MAKGIYTEHGLAMKDGQPQFFENWSAAQKEAYRARARDGWKRQGINLEKIVGDAVRDARWNNPSWKELVARYNVLAVVEGALKLAVRQMKAEDQAKRPVTRAELSRALLRGVPAPAARPAVKVPARTVTKVPAGRSR